MAYFVNALSMIAYADRKSMIPVIDMKSSLNTYIYEHEVGKINSWEYYFEQPGWLSLENALSRKDSITLKHLKNNYSKPNASLGFFYNYGGELDYWRSICRKYLRFSEPLTEKLNLEKQKFIDKRVLGVSLRGTDYLSLRRTNHAVQPEAGQVIPKVIEVMKNEKFDAVYLSTEDKNIVAEFMAHFGEKLILPEQEYINFNPDDRKEISLYSLNRDNDKYLNGLEYLTSKLLLCECKGLITSMCGGTVLTMLFSKSFDYIYVFDLGVYE